MAEVAGQRGRVAGHVGDGPRAAGEDARITARPAPVRGGSSTTRSTGRAADAGCARPDRRRTVTWSATSVRFRRACSRRSGLPPPPHPAAGVGQRAGEQADPGVQVEGPLPRLAAAARPAPPPTRVSAAAGMHLPEAVRVDRPSAARRRPRRPRPRLRSSASGRGDPAAAGGSGTTRCDRWARSPTRPGVVGHIAHPGAPVQPVGGLGRADLDHLAGPLDPGQPTQLLGDHGGLEAALGGQPRVLEVAAAAQPGSGDRAAAAPPGRDWGPGSHRVGPPEPVVGVVGDRTITARRAGRAGRRSPVPRGGRRSARRAPPDRPPPARSPCQRPIGTGLTPRLRTTRSAAGYRAR